MDVDHRGFIDDDEFVRKFIFCGMFPVWRAAAEESVDSTTRERVKLVDAVDGFAHTLRGAACRGNEGDAFGVEATIAKCA